VLVLQSHFPRLVDLSTHTLLIAVVAGQPEEYFGSKSSSIRQRDESCACNHILCGGCGQMGYYRGGQVLPEVVLQSVQFRKGIENVEFGYRWKNA
jgi:hypothetical protein